MKTTEVNKELIGRRCECIFTGLMVTGVIEDTEENEHTIEVKVRFDHPHQWGDDLYNDVWAWGRKIDEFGTLHHLQLLEDKPDFQIMTVVFGEPISRIDLYTILVKDISLTYLHLKPYLYLQTR